MSACKSCGKMFKNVELHYTKMHQVVKNTYDGIAWRLYRDDVMTEEIYIHRDEGYECAIEDFASYDWKMLPVYNSKTNEYLVSEHCCGVHKYYDYPLIQAERLKRKNAQKPKKKLIFIKRQVQASM